MATAGTRSKKKKVPATARDSAGRRRELLPGVAAMGLAAAARGAREELGRR
jgi:hypothetical protein